MFVALLELVFVDRQGVVINMERVHNNIYFSTFFVTKDVFSACK